MLWICGMHHRLRQIVLANCLVLDQMFMPDQFKKPLFDLTFTLTDKMVSFMKTDSSSESKKIAPPLCHHSEFELCKIKANERTEDVLIKESTTFV